MRDERDDKVKVTIPDFNGGMKGEDFSEWLDKVEIVFD